MNAITRKIEAILTSEFEIKNYVDLVRELFPNLHIVAPDKFRIETSDYNSHIYGMTHVGNYSTPNGENIIVIAVQLKNERSIDSSRSMQRSYAKRLIENANADAAIVAYYSINSSRWRLSFIRLDFELKVENGKIVTTENLTPVKRYSFLVGQGEPCHTAINRFDRFISDHISAPEYPELEDLEEAFSVDKVTDEFYEQYCENYKRLYKYLSTCDSFIKEARRCNFSVAQFSQKLLGQIIFLYFLQKKGWLGVEKGPWGTGSESFVRDLFETANQNNENFFHEYLEPLFYDALNTDNDLWEYAKTHEYHFPFLSGGLFEPLNGYDWRVLNLCIPNEFFSNRDLLGWRQGNGILDVFDNYNFTMKEDEPLERDIAIDPEMLGRVFERLLDVNERKKRASYYTPNSIVHYMVRETIISYLDKNSNLGSSLIRKVVEFGNEFKPDNDGEVADLVKSAASIDLLLQGFKSIDICVGSGAFILSMLNEIVKVRQSIERWIFGDETPYRRPYTLYELKLQTIKNSIFGCDIDPCAVDIAKLRLWLSLIIDDECLDDDSPKPLPNLSGHIICGNSILDEIDGCSFANPSESSTSDSIIVLKEALFDEHDWEKANRLINRIKDNYQQLINIQLAKSNKSVGVFNRDSYPFVIWKWCFPEVYREKNGFDAVIGNPPYSSTEEIHANYSDKEFEYFKNRYSTAYKQFDICFLFVEKAVELLNNNGILCYIIPNKFYKTDAGKMLRRLLGNKMVQLDDFGPLQLFQEKTIYSCIIKCLKKGSDIMKYTTVSDVFELWQFGPSKSLDIFTKQLDENPWKLTTDFSYMNLLQELEKKARPLGDYANIFNGIQTSAERPPVYWFSDDEIVRESTDEVIISKDQTEYHIEKAILHPYFKPTKASEKGMHTYSLLETNKRIIFPYNKNGSLISIDVMRRDYPGTLNYLLAYYNYLVPKCLNNGKGRDIPNANENTWYQYGRSQSLTAFIDTPKLIVRVLSKEPMYAYDNADMLIASGGTAGYCAIASLPGSKYDLSYIQAWLNHPYTEKYLQMMGSDFENGFTARGTFSLKTVPFVDLDFNDPYQKRIYDDVVRFSHRIYEINYASRTNGFSSELENEKLALEGKIVDAITNAYSLVVGVK